jgi:zinc D-Ala-D-Ala dipeptidase
MEICADLAAFRKLPRERRLSIYLVEDLMAEIPCEPVDDPIIDVRELSGSDILVLHPEMPNTFCRRSMGERLLRAAASLKERGLRCRIQELYRDIDKQRAEFEAIKADMAAKNSHLSALELWRLVTEFIADPDLCPPHCTGGAVDLQLERDGELLPMGTSINTVSELSHLMSDAIPAEHQANRRILLDAMLDQGFAPLPSEWWHFSYGEKYWGAFYDKPAMYEVTLPPR